jgi:low affinity Fe/Cu permease
LSGNHATLAIVVGVAAAWTVCGFVGGFTLERLLSANLACTVGSFLVLVFVQNSKQRETLALQTKLDQLILSSDAGNHWIGAQRHEADVIDEMRSIHHPAQ